MIDPRATQLARAADIHLAVKHGTDIAVALAIHRFLFTSGSADEAFLDRRFDDDNGPRAPIDAVGAADASDHLQRLAGYLDDPAAGPRAIGSVVDADATARLLAALGALGGARALGTASVDLYDPCGDGEACFAPIVLTAGEILDADATSSDPTADDAPTGPTPVAPGSSPNPFAR